MWDALMDWFDDLFGEGDDYDDELGEESAVYERNHEALWLEGLED
jgi:hypothetical protein